MLRTIALDKEIEIAAIERKSVVITANSDSYLIRLSSPEGTLVIYLSLHLLKRIVCFS